MSSLHILFATNFSDSCFRAIRAVAQMADEFELHLTIAHTVPDSKPRRQELHSFFAEADHYADCRRVTLQGKPAEAISQWASESHFDLIVAPGSDRLGLPRLFHRSFRAELLKRAAAPIWTTSRGLEIADFRRRLRTVAVAMDGSDADLRHLRLASSFAAHVGAKIRLLSVVPSVEEGTLSSQAWAPQPLHPQRAMARLEELLRGWDQMPTVDLAIGSMDDELPRMAAACDADILFVTEAQCVRGLFGRDMSNVVNGSPCAVVCVPDGLSPRYRWSFEQQESERNLLTLPNSHVTI
jgi:nucleotide-binding universal stress UspA family protein